MEWKPAESKENGIFKIPERWLHIYYYEALNILFRFENGMRLFVYVVLKRNLGKNWDTAALGEGATIRTETKKRIAQAREHGYLGYDVSSPMLFLNGGELAQLIVSDAYWKYFAPYFKASKSIVLTKLQEIGTVRNSLAHFRPIKQDDIDLIKQNSRHLMISIEDCLVQITSISDVVPTNSEDPWYKDLKSIGNDRLTTSLYSSRNTDWIRVQLTYSLPVLRKTASSPSYCAYLVGNLRTGKLINDFPAIRESCIYLSENVPHPRMHGDQNPSMTKHISIVLSKDSLEKNLEALSKEFREITIKIESETELITQDSLALGDLVESKPVSAVQRDVGNGHKYWRFSMEALNTAPAEIDYVEYWGSRWHYATDFISSTSHYPWMPSSISSEESPF
jgi:hypothetical protein